MHLRIACFLFLFLCPIPGYLQTLDSIQVLPVVVVEEQPLRQRMAGGRVETWGEETLAPLASSHLGELLGQQSGVFVKSYGLGSSATTSIRGAGAGHSTVLWNGLPLQSPMLGQLDFSLIPLFFTDEVQLHHGGHAAAWGSGAIGGVIQLKNESGGQDAGGFSLRSTAGSFGFWEQQAKAVYGKGAWKWVSRFFYRTAENDFPYTPAPGLPEVLLPHAALRQNGLLQELYWQPGPGQELALRIWAQQSDREIPPTLVQNRSEARQQDAFLRNSIHWKKVGRSAVWQVRGGLFRERLDYRDDLILLESLSRYWVGMAEGEAEWQLNDRQRLQAGLGHTWMQAGASAYETAPQQHRTSVFAAFRQTLGKWQGQFHLRQELVDGALTPLTPALGLERPLTNWLSVKARLSRNYRLPTFNDLYWKPGGNPDLLPESGWSQEATATAHIKVRQQAWQLSLTGFNRQIGNWILWSPRDGQFFWSADNIARVWSRGLESRIQGAFTTGNWKLLLSGGYDLILSTNEIAVAQPRIEAGEQLLYVPRHQASARLALAWKSLAVEYQHRYTGSVQALNLETLPGYHLGFLHAAQTLQLKNLDMQLFLNLHNLWNARYQVVERRPMPGRWFQAGLQIGWHSKNK